MTSSKFIPLFSFVFTGIAFNEAFSFDDTHSNPGLRKSAFPKPVLKMHRPNTDQEEETKKNITEKEEKKEEKQEQKQEQKKNEKKEDKKEEKKEQKKDEKKEDKKDEKKEDKKEEKKEQKKDEKKDEKKEAQAVKANQQPQGIKPWTITIKPLSVNFSAVTFGMSKKSLRVNDSDIDPYRSSFGYLTSRSQRAAVGYDLELGLMLTSNIEIFTNLGFSYERPFEKVSFFLPGTPNAFSVDFKARRSFEVSLGGRYYWNLDNRWYPFVGLMGTGIIQEPIKSEAFRGGPPNYISLGNFTFLDRTTLWGGAIQGGADYHFTENVSLSFSMSLRYTPRTSRKSIVINGSQLSSRENRSLWSLPTIVSLKFLV